MRLWRNREGAEIASPLWPPAPTEQAHNPPQSVGPGCSREGDPEACVAPENSNKRSLAGSEAPHCDLPMFHRFHAQRPLPHRRAAPTCSAAQSGQRVAAERRRGAT